MLLMFFHSAHLCCVSAQVVSLFSHPLLNFTMGKVKCMQCGHMGPRQCQKPGCGFLNPDTRRRDGVGAAEKRADAEAVGNHAIVLWQPPQRTQPRTSPGRDEPAPAQLHGGPPPAPDPTSHEDLTHHYKYKSYAVAEIERLKGQLESEVNRRELAEKDLDLYKKEF